MAKKLVVEITPKLLPFISKRARYKVAFGGRGCVHPDTPIDTPNGRIRIRDFQGGEVYAYKDGQIVIASATKPLEYDVQQLHMVTLSNGAKISVTDQHKFLTQRGWVACQHLYKSDEVVTAKYADASYHPQTSSAHDQLVLREDVQHSNGKRADSQESYFECFHQCGQPPQCEVDTDLTSFPLQGGVQKRNSRALKHLDDRECEIIRTLPQSSRHQPSQFAAHAEGGQSFEVLGSCSDDKVSVQPLGYTLSSHQSHGRNTLETLDTEFLKHALYSDSLKSQEQSVQTGFCKQEHGTGDIHSFEFPLSYNHDLPILIGIESISKHEKVAYWDLHVPELENYLSNGIVNHNSSKSQSVARALLVRCKQSKIRALCAREIQKSINESVHALLKQEINALGLTHEFEVLETTIRHKNGSEIIFTGLRSNITGVTSMQGIDICWVEEASTVTAESWEVLIPTIRKPESEIWITFNPRYEDDAVWTRFVVRKPTDCILIECNYIDNPWFPDVLEQERLDCLRMTPKLYEHTWLGKFKSGTDGGDFEYEWFRGDNSHAGIEPKHTEHMNKYIVVDPTRTQNKGSDYTAIAVIGLNLDGNRYVLEIVRDKLTIGERHKEMKRLYVDWECREVWYKKTGAESDIEALRMFQAHDGFRFPIVPLPENATEGGKNARIRRLVPDLQAGRWIFPMRQWRKMWDGDSRDMVQDFLQQEVMQFPHGEFDDMLDCLSGAYDVSENWPENTHKPRAQMTGTRMIKATLEL